MATSGSASEAFTGRSQFKLRVAIAQDAGSPDVPGNRTRWDYSLRVDNPTGTSGTWSGDTGSYTINIGGQVFSGTTPAGTFDFRDGAAYHNIRLGTTDWINHDADGTKTITFSASISGIYLFGSSSPSGSIEAPVIPRASVPTFSLGTAFDVGQNVTINTNRVSTGFTHTLELWEYGVGASDPISTIATGVGASYSWAVPENLATYFPDDLSRLFFLRCITYSGASLIGTKDVVFTLRAGPDIKPDMSAASINLADLTTSPVNIPSVIGGYVQGWSQLTYSISGVAPKYGSAIVSYRLKVGTQTINGITGDTAVLAVSGDTVPVTAEATDTRGRTNSKTINIKVLPWQAPLVPQFIVQRSTGTTPNPSGTNIRVTTSATVSSLKPSTTEKNQLQYRVLWRVRGSGEGGWNNPSWTTAAGISLSSLVFSPSGTFNISTSYDVKIEVKDRFATSTSATLLSVAAVAMEIHPSGVGVGKYWEQGALDVGGDVYANNVRLLPGASNAETQAGSLTTKAVTPASLKSVLDQRTGYRYMGTVLFESSGTFSKASYSNLKAVRVRLVGGGGAGAGAVTSPSGQNSYGTGGGGGGYAESFILEEDLPSSVTVTVGAGGAASSVSSPGDGGTSSFGALVVATGGQAGKHKVASTLGGYLGAGPGGVGTAGDILIGGGGGSGGHGAATLASGGAGGSSVLGGGGTASGAGGGSGAYVGAGGENYGGGGGGAATNSGGTARFGGAGAPGIVIVELYS